MKLARTIQQFKFDSKFSSWLYRVTINTAIDYQRKNKRHQDHQDVTQLPIDSKVSNSEDQLYAKELLSHVDALPDKERVAITLVISEGLTHAQAAEIMQCKEATVSGYIHQARKKLSHIKEKDYG
jgi:RNA polymerase sigma-70 factor (ECF subfamily)